MKRLANMNKQERGALLFQLFPTDSYTFLGFAERIANELVTGKKKLSVVYLREQIKESSPAIAAQHYMLMLKAKFEPFSGSHKLFGEELFKPDKIAITLFCLREYIASPEFTYKDFYLAVTLFFF